MFPLVIVRSPGVRRRRADTRSDGCDPLPAETHAVSTEVQLNVVLGADQGYLARADYAFGGWKIAATRKRCGLVSIVCATAASSGEGVAIVMVLAGSEAAAAQPWVIPA